MSFDPPVRMIPDRVPGRICDKIINYGKQLQSETGVVGSNDKDSQIRKSNISWFRDESWIAKWVIRGARDVIEDWGWEVSEPEPLQFTMYNAPDGHYTWHKDTYDTRQKEITENNDIYNRQRKVSVVCNITDPSEYEGGELEIIDPTAGPDDDETRIIKISKDRGNVIVFPSFLFHRVTPITRGTRYSLVCWFRGPEFR